jgi:cytidylate kinase
MKTRVVALSRQLGVGGEEVASLVAERLQFKVIDYQVIQEAAREAGVSPETVSEAERTPSLMTRILESLARNPGMPVAAWADPVPLSTTPLFTSADYRGFVENVIRDLAEQGSCLIVGHAAQVILRERTDTLRVLVTGSGRQRVRRVMAGMGVDEKAAQKTIEKTDAERLEFFQRVYGIGWISANAYDMCVNTDHLSPAAAADLVVYAAG